ncbi:hypothetical protein COCON_G00124370 [Conger conger]|uniref:Uncharacterized protein n=1 Tax=Conger conger TaxID=82655 RepID=A0A9Q1HYF4_CONCO|nr:hypothetical protein COCON_G00124370 [Conger conger]
MLSEHYVFFAGLSGAATAPDRDAAPVSVFTDDDLQAKQHAKPLTAQAHLSPRPVGAFSKKKIYRCISSSILQFIPRAYWCHFFKEHGVPHPATQSSPLQAC